MEEHRHGSHTVFSIHLHVVWITQYRHQVLRGAVAERVRDVVREECRRQRGGYFAGPYFVRSRPRDALDSAASHARGGIPQGGDGWMKDSWVVEDTDGKSRSLQDWVLRGS